MYKKRSFLSIAIILMLAIIAGLSLVFSFTPKYPVITLDKGWTISYRNEHYLNTNLEHLGSQIDTTFSKGDILTLTMTKPLRDVKAPFPYIMFKTQFCAYEVYLDDTLIKKEYTDDISGSTFIGIGFHSVGLPQDYAGKKLSIIMYITENDSRADILSPLLGNYDDIYRIILNSVLFPGFTSIFLILFGLVFLIISLLFYVRTTGVSSQVVCSILSSVTGLWMINAYDVIDFYVSTPFATFLEYSAMYLILPLMYLLVYILHKRQSNSVTIFLGFSSLIFAGLFIALHLFNRVHIHHFKMPFYAMCLLGLVLLIVYDIRDIKAKSKNPSTRILMLGLTVLALSFTVYGIIGMLSVIVDYRQSYVLNFLVPAGSLFFVITQLLHHFIFMTRTFAQRQEYASLTQIAYIDNLTDIPNRVSCDKRLLELNQSEDDFCILSLDLNGLKEVNDNSGHPAGDKLLKSFATCLKDVFEGTGEYFRVGGDEFLVLFTNIEKELLDSMLVTLDSKLLALDETDPEANHSVSYGYAFRSETTDRDTHSVVMLADKRMYEYKRKFYSHLMKRD